MQTREYARFRTAVRADLQRHGGGVSVPALLRTLVRERTFRPVFTMRLCQALAGRRRRALLLAAVVLHRAACTQASVDLPWKTRVGPGLRLFHGWAAVVNTEAVVGANVSLFHGVTLGQGDRIDAANRRTTGYPVIEDEVWIGPGAAVLGGVRVGRGSRIAAGAVVVRDVAPASMVLGNPATVVRTGVSADVLNPAVLDLPVPDPTVPDPTGTVPSSTS
jgi:serine O-acetyltransferase